MVNLDRESSVAGTPPIRRSLNPPLRFYSQPTSFPRHGQARVTEAHPPPEIKRQGHRESSHRILYPAIVRKKSWQSTPTTVSALAGIRMPTQPAWCQKNSSAYYWRMRDSPDQPIRAHEEWRGKTSNLGEPARQAPKLSGPGPKIAAMPDVEHRCPGAT